MDEELKNLYRNIGAYDKSILGDVDEESFVSGFSTRGDLTGFLSSLETDHPDFFKSYAKDLAWTKDVENQYQQDQAVDPFNWMPAPKYQKPTKVSPSNIAENVFPAATAIKTQAQQEIDAAILTEQKKRAAVSEEANRGAFGSPVSVDIPQLSGLEKSHIAQDIGTKYIKSFPTGTFTEEEEYDIIYGTQGAERRKIADDLTREEQNVSNYRTDQIVRDFPLNSNPATERKDLNYLRHDINDAKLNIQMLNGRKYSNDKILQATEIPGFNDNQLQRMKEFLVADDRERASQTMREINTSMAIATKREEEAPKYIKDSLQILNDIGGKKDSGAELTQEETDAYNNAITTLNDHTDELNEYERIYNRMSSLKDQALKINDKYPDIAYAEEFNRQVQLKAGKERSTQLAALKAFGPFAFSEDATKAGHELSRGALQFIPNLVGSIRSSADAGLAAIGDNQAGLNEVRRSQMAVRSGTLRDASVASRPIREQVAEFQYEGNVYDIGYSDTGAPIEIYDKTGNIADIPTPIKQKLLVAAMDSPGLVKRDIYNKDALYNTIGDVSSDIFGTMALTFATRGLGEGPMINRLREFGSIMLQYEGRGVEQALNEGLTLDQAIVKGTGTTVLEAASEAMFPFFSKVTGRGTGKGIKEALARAIAEGDKKALKKLIQQEYKQVLVGAFVQEPVEEIAVDMATPVYNKAINNAYATDLDTDFPTLRDEWDTYVLTAAVSSIPAAVGGFSAPNRVMGSQIMQESVYNVIKNFDKVKEGAANYKIKGLTEMMPIFERVAARTQSDLEDKDLNEREKSRRVTAWFDFEVQQEARMKAAGTPRADAMEAKVDKAKEDIDKVYAGDPVEGEPKETLLYPNQLPKTEWTSLKQGQTIEINDGVAIGLEEERRLVKVKEIKGKNVIVEDADGKTVALRNTGKFDIFIPEDRNTSRTGTNTTETLVTTPDNTRAGINTTETTQTIPDQVQTDVSNQASQVSPDIATTNDVPNSTSEVTTPQTDTEDKPVQTTETIGKAIEADLGVTLDVSENKGIVTVGRIVVPEGDRNKGTGTKAMERLIEHADANGLTIALTPSKDFGATNIKRLKDFYKRLGFVENKGKNKDFSTKESMIRTPKQQTSPSGELSATPSRFQPIKDFVNKLFNGTAIYERFSPQEQSGLTRGGQIHAEASLLVGTDGGTDTSASAVSSNQEKQVEEWAREEGHWIDNVEEAWGEPGEVNGERVGGTESEVWFTGDHVQPGMVAKAIKIVQPFFENLQQKLDSITLQNAYFPEAGLTVLGFGRMRDGRFVVLAEQPFIQGTRPSKEQLKVYMDKLGFKDAGKRKHQKPGYFTNGQVAARDVVPRNAIIDKDGNIFIFDPMMYLDVKGSQFEIEGKRIAGLAPNLTETTNDAASEPTSDTVETPAQPAVETGTFTPAEIAQTQPTQVDENGIPAEQPVVTPTAKENQNDGTVPAKDPIVGAEDIKIIPPTGPEPGERATEDVAMEILTKWTVFLDSMELTIPDSYLTAVARGDIEDTPENREKYQRERMKIAATKASMHSTLWEIAALFQRDGRQVYEFENFLASALNSGLDPETKLSIIMAARDGIISRNSPLRNILNMKYADITSRSAITLNLARLLGEDAFLSKETIEEIRNGLLRPGGISGTDIADAENFIDEVMNSNDVTDGALEEMEAETAEEAETRITALTAQLTEEETDVEVTKEDIADATRSATVIDAAMRSGMGENYMEDIKEETKKAEKRC